MKLMRELCALLFASCISLGASIVYSNGVPSPAGALQPILQSVRIYDPIGGGQSEAGTGTVFAASLNGNILSLGIATAAHVVQSTPVAPIQIGFGSVNSPAGFIVTPSSIITASGGGTASGSFLGADLAYLGITIDLSKNAAVAGNTSRIALLESITPDTLLAAPTSPGYGFSASGYGISAAAPSGADPTSYAFIYHPSNSSEEYGIQRSFTNSVFNYLVETLGGYTYNAGYYFLNSAASNGIGASLPGDSGSGVIVNGSLEGIVTFGPAGTSFCESSTCGYVGYNGGSEYGGVELTQSYVNWFESENLNLIAPEPGTILLAGLGVVLLLKARKKLVVG